MSFSNFLMYIFGAGSIELRMAVVLILGVIFVNGWTDAPNAITASVSTGAVSLRGGILLAAVFNFVGALTMGILNSSVLRSIGEMTMLLDSGGEEAVMILSAALLSIIIWSTIAWIFGIPTSESHALISGIVGAALAYKGGLIGNGIIAIRIAIIGLAISLPVGFLLGAGIGKMLDIIAFNCNYLTAKRVKGLQRIGAAAMAFMHGAQDSQKFAGVFLGAICMSGGYSGNVDRVPLWLTIICSIVISIGTAAGGYRIIKRVGMGTVELTPIKGLAADIAGSTCMLGASVLGMPVSTTHTATASVIGAGISSSPRKINVSSVKEMMIAWILTFPCCGLISFLAVKLYLYFV